MPVKQVVADATLALLRVADKEYLSVTRGTQPTTREELSAQAARLRRANRKMAIGHCLRALPLAGMGFDVYAATTIKARVTTRTELGLFAGLVMCVATSMGVVQSKNPLVLLVPTAYHLVMAGVDAAQASLYGFAGRHASLPA